MEPPREPLGPPPPQHELIACWTSTNPGRYEGLMLHRGQAPGGASFLLLDLLKRMREDECERGSTPVLSGRPRIAAHADCTCAEARPRQQRRAGGPDGAIFLLLAFVLCFLGSLGRGTAERSLPVSP
eukprot:m.147588 g.147588  ORF g.147588 m.147588 type:complete len:127 (+) comp10104_c1_seq9:91-471(+)